MISIDVNFYWDFCIDISKKLLDGLHIYFALVFGF
jgi:hypothetical protein